MPNTGHAIFLLKFAVLGFFCDRFFFNLDLRNIRHVFRASIWFFVFSAVFNGFLIATDPEYEQFSKAENPAI